MFLFKGNQLKGRTREKGASSILLAFLIISLLAVVSLALSYLMLQQLKMTVESGKSVVAIYAAETGVEKCLYQIRKSTGNGCDSAAAQESDTLSNNSSYVADYDGSGEIKSIGHFGNTSRRIEVTW